jgi:protein involved in polysaccharide export with SLBB domain
VKISKILPVLAAGICLLWSTACNGGGGDTSVYDPGPAAYSGSDATSDTLRIGDTLTIRLSGVPGEGGEAGVYQEKINDDGTISMPLVGKFQAAGITPVMLKQEIEAAYRDKKIYRTPNVTIIPEIRYVNLVGEVRNPGRLEFTNDMTALKAISAAGGLTDYAERKQIKIIRGNRIILWSYVQALNDPRRDTALKPGDQIQVPRTIF